MATITVPTTGTVISSAWGASVANALNAGFVQAAYAQPTTNASAIASVTFPAPFAVAPQVFLQIITPGGGIFWITNITARSTTGFSFNVLNATSGSIVANTPVNVSWLAVGARV